MDQQLPSEGGPRVAVTQQIRRRSRDEAEETEGKLGFAGYHLPARGFPGGSEDKASACNAGDPGSIPGLGRSPGEESSNPFQYSCLENPMDRGAWQAAVHGVAKSQTRLSDLTSPTCSPLYLNEITLL